ncbi:MULTISPECIES: septal ring lytic transglycosylase RlpA family protein [unclassified Helicobacter]|uniref:septal ring lytic transglycosylase RlpA family protein n=1 Tax=unclassified Helicobacter TaxID=2593540 RepID=UPI003524E072
MGRNFNASNSPVDSFSGGNSSLMAGMRESEAIQRATMRPYQIAGKWYYPTKVKIGETFDGIASWYGPNFHAKATSNGETYNMHAHTAASKTLPMNTIVKVLNKENGKTTIVRINDRGPFVEGRIIDLSNIAAKDIDMVSKGTARVKVEVIGFGGMVDKNYQNSLKISSEEIQDEFEVGESQESVQGGAFALQLGVFRQKSGAESTKQKFEGITKQYSISIKEDGELYRVFANGFQSEDEAQDFAKSQGLTPVIVRE